MGRCTRGGAPFYPRRPPHPFPLAGQCEDLSRRSSEWSRSRVAMLSLNITRGSLKAQPVVRHQPRVRGVRHASALPSEAPSGGGEGGPAGGGPKAKDPGIAARIAAAKKYKEGSGGSATSTATTPPTVSLPPSSPTSMPPRAPIDYSAMTEFLQSPPVPSRAAPPLPPSLPPLSPLGASPFRGSGGPLDGASIGRVIQDPAVDGGIGRASAPSESSGGADSSGSMTPSGSAAESSGAVPFLQREADPSLPSTELAKMILNATQVWGN